MKIKVLLVELQNRLVLILLGATGKTSKLQSANLSRLGSDYGGWWVPTETLHNSNGSRLLISAGLGFDVTFDKEMLNHNFFVIGLEPMLDSFNYARKELGSNRKLILINAGLWTVSGNVDFFAPADGSNHSWSITHPISGHADSCFSISVLSIEDVLRNAALNTEFDYSILKIDVEGAEEHILFDICMKEQFFDFIAVELDFLSLISFRDISKRIRKLRSAKKIMKLMRSSGYIFLGNEQFNFYWKRSDGRLIIV